MRIGFITTSRADFGIYLPLINAVKMDSKFSPVIFAGGMHVSSKFGNTIEQVKEVGVETYSTNNTLGDLTASWDYAKAFSNTTIAFSNIIESIKNRPELIFCLGDRFEMLAAVLGTMPFQLKLAHLHGGEDSLGALDQKYRNAITSLSDIHFTSTSDHAQRVISIIGNNRNVYNVGALGIENLLNTELIPRIDFEDKFKLGKNEPFILTTFHPETIHTNNSKLINELIDALDRIPERIICTLPNADQQGDIIRQALLQYEREKGSSKITCHENLGIKGYFSAMAYCSMMIGNTSSGIIEAASFNKLVINVGDRQLGRTSGENVHHVICESEEIVSKYRELKKYKATSFVNPYGEGKTSEKIMTILNNLE